MTIDNPHGFGASNLVIAETYDDHQTRGGRSVAEHFADLVGQPRLTPFNRYLDDTVVDLMRALVLKDGFLMIDAGCGEGKLLRRIRDEFGQNPGRLIGFDPSVQMVNIARERGSAWIDYFKCGILNPTMEIPKGQADLVTCVNVVHYLSRVGDVELAYRNCGELLKPGGTLLIATSDHASTSGWRDMTEDGLREWITKGRDPMDWSMPGEDGSPVFRLKFYPYMNDEHVSALGSAGFQDIRLHRQLPPREEIKDLNAEVYNLLCHNPIFVFFEAKKQD